MNYLEFSEGDELPSIDDLHLPLLKRTEFEEEHEIRLVRFSSEPIPSQGFNLHCNLQDVVNEIVVGPHAQFESTIEEIAKNAGDLRGIPITRSTLAPRT